MKKKLLIGLSAIGVAAGFWACGGGTVEPMNADDDFIRAMLNAEEGGLQLSTQIEKAKNQCTEDLDCYNEMIKANGRELESSSSEAPVSSSTPVSSVKASSSSFMPFSSIGPIGPGNSSSSSTPPVQSSSSSDTPLTGLGDCHPESETVELDAKTKWKFDMGPSFGGITAITSAQFEWSFPDGTPTSGTVQRSVNSPDVSYSTSGQKTASVKVTLGTSGSETITCSKKLQVNGLPITGCKCTGDNLEPDVSKGESASWILSGCISRANIISYTWTGATADATGQNATAPVTAKGDEVKNVSVAVANDDNTVVTVTCPDAKAIDMTKPDYLIENYGNQYGYTFDSNVDATIVFNIPSGWHGAGDTGETTFACQVTRGNGNGHISGSIGTSEINGGDYVTTTIKVKDTVGNNPMALKLDIGSNASVNCFVSY